MTSSTFSVAPPLDVVDETLVERHVLDPTGPFFAVDDLREEVGVTPFGVHVRHREEAVEVVEADVLGLGLLVLADVPLPDRLGRIARIGEQLREGDLAFQPAGLPVHRGTEKAVPHRQASGHEGCTRRRAGWLRVARGQEQPPPREPVDVGSGCTDRDPAPVAAEVAPTDVVEEDHEHVGPPPRGPVPVERGTRPLLLFLEDEPRFEVVAQPSGLRDDRIVSHQSALPASKSARCYSGPLQGRLAGVPERHGEYGGRRGSPRAPGRGRRRMAKMVERPSRRFTGCLAGAGQEGNGRSDDRLVRRSARRGDLLRLDRWSTGAS